MSKGIRVGRKELLRALEPVVQIQRGKSAIPGFNQVRIGIDGTKLTAIGFGGLASYRTLIDTLDNSAPVTVVVETDKLVRACSSLTTAEISIEAKADKLVITGNVKTTITTLADDLPAFGASIETSAQCEFRKFLTTLQRIDPAVSEDTTRAHVNAVSLLNGQARSTDGHRLAIVDSDDAIKDLDILIPDSCVDALRKMAADAASGAVVKIGHDENRTKGRFDVGDQTLIHALVDQKFPHVEQVIPKGEAPCVARVPRATLAEAIGSFIRASSGNEKTGIVLKVTDDKFHFGSAGGEPDRVSVDGSVDAVTSGSLSQCGANAKYILDALNMFDGDHVDIEFRGELDPIAFKSGAADDRDIAVVMPMRV